LFESNHTPIIDEHSRELIESKNKDHSEIIRYTKEHDDSFSNQNKTLL